MRIRLELDRNYQQVLFRTAPMRKMLDRVAGAIANEAKNIAPRDEGDYRDNIDVVIETDKDGLVAHVNANWFTSHWIEFGTVDTPVFAPLRRAMESGAARRVL